jgi:hypothetical protein
MEKRLRKKRHKQLLHLHVVDLGQLRLWRQWLFDAPFHAIRHFDRHRLDGVPAVLAAAIRAHDLRFEITKVQAEEAPAWLRDSGLIVFRFRAVELATVVLYSGNNPNVI